MKKFGIIISALIIILCVTNACTHNNGDIGFLFGQWRLHEITSESAVEQCDTVFLAFQSNIVQLRKVIYSSYDYNLLTGLYERQDNYMRFSFLNLNGADVLEEEQKTQLLSELASLHIEETAPLFQIIQLTRSQMILKYNQYEYHLEKLQ